MKEITININEFTFRYILYSLYRKLSTGESKPPSSSKKSSMDHFLWVATDSESSTVVGAIGVKIWKSTIPDNNTAQNDQRVEIVHFCVDSLLRNQGIGSQLLTQAIQFCRQSNSIVVNLTLLSTFEDAR